MLLSASLLFIAAAPSAAHTPTEISQDPLVRQIFARQLQPGGITAAVRVKGTDKGIPLELAPLAPAPGLRPQSRRSPLPPARRADEQLQGIRREGRKASWDRPRR